MSQSDRSSALSSPVWLRIVGTVVGAVMVILSLWRFGLYYLGDTAVAELHDESFSWRKDVCTHNIRYEFSVDGEVYSGATRVPTDSTSLEGVSDRVYYFSFAPSVNALEYDAQPSFSQIVFVAAGAAIIVFVNKKTKNKSQKG